MTLIRITGFKKIEKNNKTFFLLYGLAEAPEDGITGLATYSAFVNLEHLTKYKIKEQTLVGALADYYNVKDGDRYKTGITFKNTYSGQDSVSADVDPDLPV